MATFLIISPEPWAAHAVSKHHYALTLAARNHDVLFVNPPTDAAELTLTRPADAERVQVVDGPPVARGLRFLPASARRLLEARWLERLEARSGTGVDAVWLFENSRFYDLSFAGNRLKLYHQVDLNQDFHPHAAARSADICLCTTDIIRAELLKAVPRVHKIHHGTPTVPRPQPLTDAQRERFRHGGVNAAYVGNLAMEYIDVDLLLSTVEAHPQVRFHLIGSYSEESRLWLASQTLRNIVWWGGQPSALIPSLLDEADVVMCTYRASEYRGQLASPHKFMEYFASGNPIVSTYTDEYKDKRGLLCMVDDSADYVAAFGQVVANLAFHNSPARREQRRTFAATHSYEAQLDRIGRLVAGELPRHAGLFVAAQPGRTPELVS